MCPHGLSAWSDLEIEALGLITPPWNSYEYVIGLNSGSFRPEGRALDTIVHGVAITTEPRSVEPKIMEKNHRQEKNDFDNEPRGDGG